MAIGQIGGENPKLLWLKQRWVHRGIILSCHCIGFPAFGYLPKEITDEISGVT